MVATEWSVVTMLLWTVLIWLDCARTGQALKCYECNHADSNDDCNKDAHLTDCDAKSTPATKYDICQTRVSFTKAYGYSILKRCTVGPCHLGGPQEVALGLDCDRSTPEWTCESCCATDKCNENEAASRAADVIVTMTLVLAGLFLTSRMVGVPVDTLARV